jgi:hypothetical protein
MFALSRMCEDDLFERSNVYGPGSEDGFALESYNRAIRSLISQMHNPERIEVLLMTCLIFICISCLRGDNPLALKHIDGGIKLLATWRETYADPSQRAMLPATTDFTFVEETLVPMFAWLNMIASGFGNRPINPASVVAELAAEPIKDVTTAAPFDTIQDSITSLMNLIHEVSRFIIAASQRKYTPPPTAADRKEQLRLQAVFAD